MQLSQFLANPAALQRHFLKDIHEVGESSGATQYLFDSIEQVQQSATEWLWSYNHERPNMALGGITPMQRLAAAA